MQTATQPDQAPGQHFRLCVVVLGLMLLYLAMCCLLKKLWDLFMAYVVWPRVTGVFQILM